MESDKKEEKKPHPRENANILSVLTFWWMLPTFFAGYKKDLETADLYETLKEHRSDKMGNKLEEAWNKELINAKKNNREPNLFRALVKIFGRTIIFYGCICAFLELFVKMVQPIALRNLILYYSQDPEKRNIEEAYIYAAALILSNTITIVLFQSYLMGTSHLAMKLNISMCSLMYRKSLRFSKKALGQTTVGQIVNLMSNDLKRLNNACTFIHNLWIGPIAAVILTYIMYQEIGYYAIFGTLYIICCIPFQSLLGKWSAVLRLKIALKTDNRLRLMNEIINGIQVIKMYTWEKPFAALVALARRKEISKIRATNYIRGFNKAIILFNTRAAIFLTILVYVLFGNEITAAKVFVVTACLNLLKHTMTDFFPSSIALVAEAYVSIQRVNKFLLYDETSVKLNSLEYKDDDTEKSNHQNGSISPFESNISNSMTKDGSIIIKNVSAKWNNELTDNTLSSINLSVVPGKLVAVIGPVGSGKTSLLHTILRELPQNDGLIDVNGVVSYAPQEPWLFAASIRQNILFGEEMEKIRYQNVIDCCALLIDFETLPYGDKTIVGERGVRLSGGQKARISLARAVYKKADIYLLDDPLSAVDTHVGKQLFDTCINGMLKEKTVILITHQLQYLKDVDQIIILNNGIKEAEGSYHQLQESGLDFAKLLDDKTQKEEEIDNLIETKKNSIKSNSTCDKKTNGNPQEVKEQKSIGKVSGEVYKTYLKAAGNGCTIFNVLLFFSLSQLFASACDYFISYWVNLEEDRSHNRNSTQNGTYDETIVTEYNFLDFSTESCVYIYSGLILLTIVITLARSFIFFKACMNASITLHDNMFTSITRATIRFFNTNSSGRILNRFSKDMGDIDELLPSTLFDVLQIGLTLVGIIAVIAIVNPWLMIPTGIILCIFYGLRMIYLSTSRSIKRLDGVTSSPIFGHLAASLQGLTTIRAFQATAILQKEFDHHQDLHSTAWYLFIAASRIFSLWLEFICDIYISIVTISFFVTDEEQYGGNVGLAITQALSMLRMLQWGIRQTSAFETQMTSVERVNEFIQIDHEKPLESAPNKRPQQSWPNEGRIEFQNIYLNYVPNDPPVLKNLCFKVEPQEKIGIVGRTGAGKSSLIAALFQLTETTGAIIIDGINIVELGLHDIRSKISIIPQEPVLFSGTMRKNLDPFDEYSDVDLWKALEEVELKQVVADLPGDLNSKMSEGGSNFSVGQRQLVCLARAIVRNNKILVLDEATANVDPQTDALIQQTIRSKFENCTVLTIAHRLHTVMDSDKVLVMDAGTMVEFDHPHVLLTNQNGHLYKMVEQTGYAMAESLKHVAAESFRSNNQKKDV